MMSRSLALVSMLALASCGGPKRPEPKPYKFDRNQLDELVKGGKALYDVMKRPDGTLVTEKYFLGDTVRYFLTYDEKSNLSRVIKLDEHGQEVYEDFFYPGGQRKSHYPMAVFPQTGPASVIHGYYEEYFEDAKLKEAGIYEKGKQMWKLKYDKEGNSGDTTFFEYPDMP